MAAILIINPSIPHIYKGYLQPIDFLIDGNKNAKKYCSFPAILLDKNKIQKCSYIEMGYNCKDAEGNYEINYNKQPFPIAFICIKDDFYIFVPIKKINIEIKNEDEFKYIEIHKRKIKIATSTWSGNKWEDNDDNILIIEE